MKRTTFALFGLIIGMMGLAVGFTSATGSMISNVVFSVNSNGTDCADVIFQIDFTQDPLVDDWNGFDVFGITIVDANGVAVGSYWNGWLVGSGSYAYTAAFGRTDVINSITARPLTITFYDTTTNLPLGANNQTIFDGVVNQNAPIIGKYVIDPADYSAVCASLPLILPPAPPSAPTDGRINADNNAPVVVFAVAGGLQVYLPQGGILFDVTAEQIADVNCPATGEALIAEKGNVKLYRTASCGFKLTAPALDTSKTYYLLFASLTSSAYTSFEQ